MVRAELDVALHNLAQSEMSDNGASHDRIWRTNAHTELAIGILKLIVAKGDLFGDQIRSASKVHSKTERNLEHSIPEIRDTLRDAALHLEEGLYKKSLQESRSARDALNDLLLEGRKKEMKKRRT